MARTETYEIQVERPKGVSVSDMRKYIRESIERWSKGGDADDPKWNIKVVWVTKITPIRIAEFSHRRAGKITMSKELFNYTRRSK